MQQVADWYMLHINYGTVILLMTIESSFIPFPSEIIVPPAAWKAAQGELNVWLVLLSASIGAMFGAIINYFLALKLGRPILYRLVDTRLAHAMLLDREGLEKAEKFFVKNGRISTLVGRLVPGIRQLISIPAGLSRMNLKVFLSFTFIGATIWNIVLVLLGYFLYSQKELLQQYYSHLSMVGAALGALFVAYIVFRAVKAPKSVENA
ncbi:MAG: DedA family protein [Fibrobacter sp.]|nr:DedA family protein [Fibrobacter sp.]